MEGNYKVVSLVPDYISLTIHSIGMTSRSRSEVPKGTLFKMACSSVVFARFPYHVALILKLREPCASGSLSVPSEGRRLVMRDAGQVMPFKDLMLRML